MSDTDEICAALSAAVQMPGDVKARSGAAEVIRRRARSRRRTTVASFVVAVPASVVVVALLAGTLGSDGDSLTPATRNTSPLRAISVAPGPRELATPIEFRAVLKSDVPCATVGSVPEVGESQCLELGPAAMVVRRVQDLTVRSVQTSTTKSGHDAYLAFTMTEHDGAAFNSLTARLLHKRIAFVVKGVVQSAPTIAAHITAGEFQIVLDAAAGGALVAELTG